MSYYVLWISPYIQAVGYYGNINDALEYFKTKSLLSEYIAFEKDEFILNNIYVQVPGKHIEDTNIKIWRSKDPNDMRCCSGVSADSAAFILGLDKNEVSPINTRRVKIGL